MPYSSRNSSSLSLPLVGGIVLLVLGLVAFVTCTQSVPAGHFAVGSMFGKIKEKPLAEGFHFVNPFADWENYDVREKTQAANATVPTQDQLETKIKISVQYRLIGAMTPQIKKEVGNAEAAIQVHMLPKLHSAIREQGKHLTQAEDLFRGETQENMQAKLTSIMQEFLSPKGIKVDVVLIKDVDLPPTIVAGIEAKKKREQLAEQQVAELERFETEQQQKVKQAEAELAAASKEAEGIKLLANARAYEIEALEAKAGKGTYVKLKALEALGQISKDPAAKLYFIDGTSANPLPLMHINESK